jgi:plastocyanin
MSPGPAHGWYPPGVVPVSPDCLLSAFMPPKHLRLAAVTAVAALALVACGGDDDAGDTPPPADGPGLHVGAKDSLEFDTERYEAAPGEIEIELIDVGSLNHTLVVEGHESALRLSVTGQGTTDSGSLDLPEGSYTIYCDVPGHRSAGMEATLVVS